MPCRGRQENPPPVLQVIIARHAWSVLSVLPHTPWLGRLLAASTLRHTASPPRPTSSPSISGLKSIPVDRRRHRSRETRLLALLAGPVVATELRLKEHDRFVLAREMMERRLIGRRTSSKLPVPIALVMAKPLVSAGMVVKTLTAFRTSDAICQVCRTPSLTSDGDGRLIRNQAT